jgi:DNA-binding response OmpR family regulator
MKKILLVEDEKILLEMYEDKLKQAGFKVFVALEIEKGLKLAKKEKPDLIILDILLFRQALRDGISFLTLLRKDPEVASIPVVAFSNYDDPKTKKLAKELGAKAYLIKTNYTPEEIIKKIKGYLK